MEAVPTLARTIDYDYDLPSEQIAQQGLQERGDARLFVFDRKNSRTDHHKFSELSHHLKAGDLLVLNDSKVIPARLRGVKKDTGARIEVLLLDPTETNEWWAMLRPGKRARPGTQIHLLDRQSGLTRITFTVVNKDSEGRYLIQFQNTDDITPELDRIGETPLPPYITRTADEGCDDRTRYQTVYASMPGSVAAPTAGLHFTPSQLSSLTAAGVRVATLTLHVGWGTFAPIKTDDINDHQLHSERYTLNQTTISMLAKAKAENRRVVAVGTTTVRALEAAALKSDGPLEAGSGRTNIFIHPPYKFRVVDALITNFHLPKSSLLMLVSAFASPGTLEGKNIILELYRQAIERGYRFYSYGDAMFIH